MNKTSNAQYNSSQFSSLKDGYKLTYTEKDNRLKLVYKDGSIIFDVSLDEIEGIYKMYTFLIIKLKDNTRHFISFGIILNSIKDVASLGSTDMNHKDEMYSDTMDEWVKLLISKGIKLKRPTSIRILYFILYFCVANFVLLIILRLILLIVKLSSS